MTLPRKRPNATSPSPQSSGCWRLRGLAACFLLTRLGVLGRSLPLAFLRAMRPCSPAQRRLLPARKAGGKPSALCRRQLAARVGEDLVDDLPRAVDPREREDVDKRHPAPAAALLQRR